MAIHLALCLLSAAASAILFATAPSLSLWLLPLTIIGGYVALFVLLILLIVLLSFGMRGAAPSAIRRLFFRLIAGVASWVCLVCGVRIIAEGKERLPKHRPFLLAGNHLSNFDPIIALIALRDFEVVFISKPENFTIPVVGLVLRNAGFLPIDRENPRNAVTTIKTAAQHIAARGLCVGIYPEGTRNKSGEGLLPFHNGSFKIATTAKCPVAVMTARYEKGAFPYRRIARIRVVEILDADYIAANRTDAISECARSIIEADLKK